VLGGYVIMVAVAAAFLSRGSLATIFHHTSMQKAILESRIQFTTLLKVISEEWDETINNSSRRPSGRVNLDTLGDTQWMDFFRWA
jgi:hypothetical protein